MMPALSLDVGALLIAMILAVLVFATLKADVRSLKEYIGKLDLDRRRLDELATRQDRTGSGLEFLEKLLTNKIDGVSEKIDGTDARLDELRRRVEDLHANIRPKPVRAL